jgi:hypothetical protein
VRERYSLDNAFTELKPQANGLSAHFRRKHMTISKIIRAASAAIAGFSIVTALAIGAAKQSGGNFTCEDS